MSPTLPTPLRREIASVKRDIFHPYTSTLLLPNDETLATRGGTMGLRTYDDLERDPRVFAVMQKRKMAIIAYPWIIDPASPSPRDRDAALFVTRALQRMNFTAACVGLLDAVLKGYAVGEVMWVIEGGAVWPSEVRLRDQRRFRFDIEYRPRLLTLENILEGEPLPDRKFIVHSFGAKDSSPYGLGLGTRLFWPVFFKRQDIGFWLTFLDKFGSPTAIGKYPAGADQSEQAQLMAVLQAIAQDSGVVIPETLEIDFLEAQRSGTVDAYERMARYMDEQIAEIVLGETLSTNVGGSGSKAAADTHNDVRLELTQGDAELLAATFNRTLLPWIVELNLPGAGWPRLRFEVRQQEDLKARAERDQIIASLGFRPSVDYINATYGGEWAPRPPDQPSREARAT
ncbi:MAG TPA: DUF935 family protein [Stellaceae bacterium]|nr:DUF935 family protein [Stellaceae bacterium]